MSFPSRQHSKIALNASTREETECHLSPLSFETCPKMCSKRGRAKNLTDTTTRHQCVPHTNGDHPIVLTPTKPFKK